MEKEKKFKNFLQFLAATEDLPINTTAAGTTTIQQTLRNKLRMDGVAALKADLLSFYGDEVDIVETKDGIVFVVENDKADLTISWELKSTIKALNFDPFEAANMWDDERENKERAKQERGAAQREVEEKRKALLEKMGTNK